MPHKDPLKRSEYHRLYKQRRKAGPDGEAFRSLLRVQERNLYQKLKDDPAFRERQRAKNARHRAKNRAKLAAAERDRIARKKLADLLGWSQKIAERAKRHRQTPKGKASSRRHARKSYEKKKNDDDFKQKNVLRSRTWYQANKPRARGTINLRTRKRYATDLHFRIGLCLRRRMYMAIKYKYTGSQAIHDLGCSLAFLIEHLEGQFRPGMTWDNWGRNGWHIDHIMPLRSFDLSDPSQYAAACHYTNLQPLWSHDNVRKGARLGKPRPEDWPANYQTALQVCIPLRS
jgi:hypothetical protein